MIFSSLPFAILLATFFFMFVKLPQYASMFWFTQNQQEVIQACFAAGALIGAQGFNFLVIAFHSVYRFTQSAIAISFVICVIVLEYNHSSMASFCVIVAFFGLFLTILISQELYRLDNVKENGVIPLSFTLFGILGCGLTWAADKTHYMNRDDPRWSYINLALTAPLVLLGVVFSIGWISNGCRCCKCCCKCCTDCCGTYDEDDEDSEEE